MLNLYNNYFDELYPNIKVNFAIENVVLRPHINILKELNIGVGFRINPNDNDIINFGIGGDFLYFFIIV